MVSNEQLAEEQRKEREYNKVFELAISKSPFGQWYGLMQTASDMLTRNLPKRVGIDEDGRPMVVYKGDAPKIMGVWAEPTHKVIARDLGKKQYGKAIGALLGIGQIQEIIRQKRAIFFDISPEEVGEMHNKRVSKETNKLAPTTNDIKVKVKKYNYVPLLIFSLLGVATVLTLVFVKRNNT